MWCGTPQHLWHRVTLFFVHMAPLFLCAGCLSGTAGVAIAIFFSAEEGESGQVNRPPAPPIVEAPFRTDADHVLITYILFDDDGGHLDVKVEWQPVDEDVQELLPFAPAMGRRLKYRRVSPRAFTSSGMLVSTSEIPPSIKAHVW